MVDENNNKTKTFPFSIIPKTDIVTAPKDLLKITTKTGEFQIFTGYIIGFHLDRILDNYQCRIYTFEETIILNDITNNITELTEELQTIMKETK